MWYGTRTTIIQRERDKERDKDIKRERERDKDIKRERERDKYI